MTSGIDPVAPGAGSLPTPVPIASADSNGFASALEEACGPTATAPAATTASDAGPPPEVLAQTAAAARTWESLAASGREVHFEENPGGHVGITLRRSSGERLAVLDLNDLYTLIDQEGAAD